jgi:hypothetical protein
MVLEHVDGCWRVRGISPINSIISFVLMGGGGNIQKFQWLACRPPAQLEIAKLHNFNLRLNPQTAVEIAEMPIRAGPGWFAYGSSGFRAIGGRFIEMAPQWLAVASRKLR